jgi:hypothetical protein
VKAKSWCYEINVSSTLTDKTYYANDVNKVFTHDDFVIGSSCVGLTWVYQAFEIVSGVD